MLVFLIALVIFVFVDHPLLIERYGRKDGKQTLVVSLCLFVFGYGCSVLAGYLIGKQSDYYGWLLIVIFVLFRLFVPSYWRWSDENERSRLAGTIQVETWYWSGEAYKWLRLAEVQTLRRWCRANNVNLDTYNLIELRKYSSYHWLYFETVSEKPMPECSYAANITGLMVLSHKIGPYSKLDKMNSL